MSPEKMKFLAVSCIRDKYFVNPGSLIFGIGRKQELYNSGFRGFAIGFEKFSSVFVATSEGGGFVDYNIDFQVVLLFPIIRPCPRSVLNKFPNTLLYLDRYAAIFEIL